MHRGGAQGPALLLGLHETLAAVDLATAVGALGQEQAAAMQALGLRFKRMLRALRR